MILESRPRISFFYGILQYLYWKYILIFLFRSLFQEFKTPFLRQSLLWLLYMFFLHLIALVHISFHGQVSHHYFCLRFAKFWQFCLSACLQQSCHGHGLTWSAIFSRPDILKHSIPFQLVSFANQGDKFVPKQFRSIQSSQPLDLSVYYRAGGTLSSLNVKDTYFRAAHGLSTCLKEKKRKEKMG